VPYAFIGELPVPGLLLQFGQVINNGVESGMGGGRKETEPEK
jgi:hypothetical protein